MKEFFKGFVNSKKGKIILAILILLMILLIVLIIPGKKKQEDDNSGSGIKIEQEEKGYDDFIEKDTSRNGVEEDTSDPGMTVIEEDKMSESDSITDDEPIF